MTAKKTPARKPAAKKAAPKSPPAPRFVVTWPIEPRDGGESIQPGTLVTANDIAGDVEILLRAGALAPEGSA